jgi:hypothetical protein
MKEGRGRGDPLEAKWVKFGNERRKHDKVGTKYEMKTDKQKQTVIGTQDGIDREKEQESEEGKESSSQNLLF